MQDNRKTPQWREPRRSLTWPSPTLQASSQRGEVGNKDQALSSSTATDSTTASRGTFEDELDKDPQNHFLSPIQRYEYEDWSDDDSDGEEVEWDAGITDFALFDSDRRRAQDSNEPLPSKWANMLAHQASALQRAVQRGEQHTTSDSNGQPPLTSDNDVPSLTPDASPDLRDDLDVESYHGQNCARPVVPNYLTVVVSPPDGDDEAAAEEDEDLPLSTYFAQNKRPKKAVWKVERPGLRHARTMSGHTHSWTRPGRDMYTVGEDAEAEARAEQASSVGCNEDRGRR